MLWKRWTVLVVVALSCVAAGSVACNTDAGSSESGDDASASDASTDVGSDVTTGNQDAALVDASHNEEDAAEDVTVDAASDAAVDAPVDALFDVAADAPVDAPVDAPLDALDSAIDAPNDALAPPPGTLDTTFGDGGLATTCLMEPDGGCPPHQVGAVAVRPDGRVAVGAFEQHNIRAAVVQFASDGGVDTAFADGGRWDTPYDAVNGTRAEGLALLPSGALLFATGDNDLARGHVVKLTEGGALDSSFGSGGVVTCAPEAPSDKSYVSAIYATASEIFVAGYEGVIGTTSYVLRKLDSTRAPDTAFGTNGKVKLSSGNNVQSFANAVAVQSTGKIVVTGDVLASSGGGYTPEVHRFLTTGTVDSTFQTGIDLNNPHDFQLVDMAMGTDDSVIALGVANGGPLSIWKFQPDGALATSFGSSGTATGDAHTSGFAMKLDSSGRILVTGAVGVTNGAHMQLRRYLANGQLDSTFATGGVFTSTGNYDIGSAIDIAPDGKIVVAGFTNDSYSIAVWRFNP